jgi:hypothetical protein
VGYYDTAATRRRSDEELWEVLLEHLMKQSTHVCAFLPLPSMDLRQVLEALLRIRLESEHIFTVLIDMNVILEDQHLRGSIFIDGI